MYFKEDFEKKNCLIIMTANSINPYHLFIFFFKLEKMFLM